MNNMLSYCGLVDAKIRASDKDLPVSETKAESIPRPPRKGETRCQAPTEPLRSLCPMASSNRKTGKP